MTSEPKARKYPARAARAGVLTVDVGGSNVKEVLNGLDERRRFASGDDLTPDQMVTGVLEQTADWDYVGISVGIPAPVIDGKVVREPVNLGHGLGGVRLRGRRSGSRRRSSTTRRCRRSEATTVGGCSSSGWAQDSARR